MSIEFKKLGNMCKEITRYPTYYNINYVSQGIPFTYAIDTIRRLNIAGSGLLEIWMNLAILSGSIVVLSGISTMVLKREIR